MFKFLNSLLIVLTVFGCSSKQEQIKGAFGFSFGERPQLYKFKSGDDYELVVEPATVKEPNPLFKEYSLILDTKSKRITGIAALNGSLSPNSCRKLQSETWSVLRDKYEFLWSDTDLYEKTTIISIGKDRFGSKVSIGCRSEDELGFLLINYSAPENPTVIQSDSL